MSLSSDGPATMLGVGTLQVALTCGFLHWLTRKAQPRLRWGRIAGVTLGLCLLPLPLVVILLWWPSEDTVTRGRLGLAAIVLPVVAGFGVLIRRVYREARQRQVSGQTPGGPSSADD